MRKRVELLNEDCWRLGRPKKKDGIHTGISTLIIEVYDKDELNLTPLEPLWPSTSGGEEASRLIALNMPRLKLRAIKAACSWLTQTPSL